MTSERLLQALITVVGVIAVGVGLYGVATGVGGMPGEHAASASVDSELRFFSVFWIAYGVVALRVAPRVADETTAVRALALALFIAGLARAVSWLDVGEPDPLYVGLMCAELIAPPLIVIWQARLVASHPRR